MISNSRVGDNPYSRTESTLRKKELPQIPLTKPEVSSQSKLKRLRDKMKRNPQVRFSLPINSLLDKVEVDHAPESPTHFTVTPGTETPLDIEKQQQQQQSMDQQNGSQSKIKQHQKNSSSVYSLSSLKKSKRRNSMFPFPTTSQDLVEGDTLGAFVKPRDQSHFKISVPLVIRTPPKLSKFKSRGDDKLNKEMIFNGSSYEMVSFMDRNGSQNGLQYQQNELDGYTKSIPENASPLRQTSISRQVNESFTNITPNNSPIKSRNYHPDFIEINVPERSFETNLFDKKSSPLKSAMKQREKPPPSSNVELNDASLKSDVKSGNNQFSGNGFGYVPINLAIDESQTLTSDGRRHAQQQKQRTNDTSPQFIRSHYQYPPPQQFLNVSVLSEKDAGFRQQGNNNNLPGMVDYRNDYTRTSMPNSGGINHEKRLSQSPRKHNHLRSKSQINILNDFDNLNIAEDKTSPRRKPQHGKNKSQSNLLHDNNSDKPLLIYSQTAPVKEIIIPELNNTPFPPSELQKMSDKLDNYLKDQVERTKIRENDKIFESGSYKINTRNSSSPRRVMSPLLSHSSHESTFSLAHSASTHVTSVIDSENMMIDLTREGEEIVVMRNKLKGSITSYRSIRQKDKLGKTIEVILVDDDNGEVDMISDYANDFNVHDSIRRQNSVASENDELARVYSLYGKLGKDYNKTLAHNNSSSKGYNTIMAHNNYNSKVNKIIGQVNSNSNHYNKIMAQNNSDFKPPTLISLDPPLERHRGGRHSSSESDLSTSSFFVGDEKNIVIGKVHEWKTRPQPNYSKSVESKKPANASSPYILAPSDSAKKPKQKRKDEPKAKKPSLPPLEQSRNYKRPDFRPTSEMLNSIDNLYENITKEKSKGKNLLASMK